MNYILRMVNADVNMRFLVTKTVSCNMLSKYRNHFILHGVIFIWGWTAILGKLISLQAIPLVWWRVLIAFLVLGVYLKFKKQTFAISFKTLAQLFGVGVIIALHWICFYQAIKVSNVSITLACLSTGALFASLIEPMFYKRKVNPWELLLGAIALIGLLIIFKLDTHYLAGILYSISAAALGALFTVLNGKLVEKHSPTLISFYEMIGGFLIISLYLGYSQAFVPAFFQVSLLDWIYLILLGSVCTALAFAASVEVMKTISPYTVVLSVNLEPVYGIVLALLIFKDSEKMNPAFYLGALLILGSILINAWYKAKMQGRKEGMQ